MTACYLIVSLFTTRLTPVVCATSSPSRVLSASVGTAPVIVTTPSFVSTSIYIARPRSSDISRVFTALVIDASLTTRAPFFSMGVVSSLITIFVPS